MTSEDIVGGIKNAIARGSSLKDAMQSFYNAGYKKEDIENAVRKIQSEGFETTNNQMQVQNKSSQISITKPTQSIQTIAQNQPQQIVQKKQSSNLGWIILLVGLFIILIATAILFIFFKDKLISFFNSIVK